MRRAQSLLKSTSLLALQVRQFYRTENWHCDLESSGRSLGRPCVGIPTLQAVAHAGGSSAATVALLPAGRGEVFAQMFSVSEDGIVAELDSAAHLSPPALLARYGGLKNLKWAGERCPLATQPACEVCARAGHLFLRRSGRRKDN